MLFLEWSLRQKSAIETKLINLQFQIFNIQIQNTNNLYNFYRNKGL